MRYENCDISILKGEVVEKITNNDNEEMIIECESGKSYKMYHEQDCCEYVTIEDLSCDIQRLVGEEVINAYSSSKDGEEGSCGDTSTWTFYTINTLNNSLTIRWYGSSNGYYSEGVSFIRIK